MTIKKVMPTTSMITFILISLLTGLSCGKLKKKHSDQSSSTPSATTLTIGDAQEGDLKGLDIATYEISQLHQNMIPGSLVIAEDAQLASDPNDPCAGLDFIGCQPNLLKLYLKTGKDMVAAVNEIINATKDVINNLAINSSGDLTPSDNNEVTKLQYKVNSANAYALILHSTKGPYLYLSVNREQKPSQYFVSLNGDNSPEDNSNPNDQPPPIINISVQYTSESDFSVDVDLGGFPCRAEDVRAPENIHINLIKSAEKTQGKAMMYLPRWLGADPSIEPTCETTKTVAHEMQIYSDFVGNDTESSASFYMLNQNVSLNNLASYPLSAFCSHFSSYCQSGQAFGSAQPIGNYQNPACINKANSQASWNQDCQSVPSTHYSSSDLWKSPVEMTNFSLQIPDAPEIK